MTDPVDDARSWSTGPAQHGAGLGQGGGTEPERRKGSFFSELPVLILIAFILALLMKTFLVQAFYIPSSSMEPTLLIDDRVLVNKLAHTFREPRRGEIVVFSERGFAPAEDEGVGIVGRVVRSVGTGLGLIPPTEKDFIKRIIGLPGETVEMRDGVVHIDGQPITEAPTTEGGYLSARDLSDFGPVTVPAGEYFMMGDNRPQSADSRTSLGTIPAEHIIGRAFVVIWPFGRFSHMPVASYGASESEDVSFLPAGGAPASLPFAS